MNNRLGQAPQGASDDETILQPAAESGDRANVYHPKREIVAGSGPHLTNETQALLRLRLRAAALMLLIGFGVFLLRHLVGVLSGEPLFPALLGVHVLVVLVLSLIAAPLWWHSDVSIKNLRIAELVIFGLPAAFFLMLQHDVSLDAAARDVMPPWPPFWLLLIFTYGMFIPNTWRRAAIVIGSMALAPMLLLAGMTLFYPQVAALLTVTRVMQQSLVLVIAVVASVVGTRLVNTLRREVFEARQVGQYRLIKTIGAGGMGEVYLAEHRMLKRPCAIKLIRPEHAGDPRVLARFEREVQLTAQLSHWNTVEIFDYGRTDDGTFFYVMEYLPGLSLEDVLKRRGPLPAERVIHLLRQACRGLREAHGVGLIHRDIKPANVFAAHRGGLYDVVKLLDFGLVKLVNENPSTRLSQEGGISGTPLFMSPEQARGQSDLDARSDIYSLGAVAYALLTGRPPFDGANAMDVMIAHVRDEVAWPSKYADVPADLEAVVLRCLAKSPADRFQDVDSLEQALAGCAAADQWTQWHAARWWHENNQTEATPHEMSLAATAQKKAGGFSAFQF
ncbi:MAG: serine/threonine-protein kinase [Isosphaeraceae bacterium]